MDGKRRSLLAILILVAISYCSANIRLDKLIIPHHYNVELTLNVEEKTFSVDERIQFELLEDSNRISLNMFNLEGDWLDSVFVRPINQDVQYTPFAATTRTSNEEQLLILDFEFILEGKTTYNIQFSNISGVFGSGFVEAPLWNSDRYLLTTGFDNTNLRSVFPCFDEPEYKATFDFTVYHTEGYSLLHNFIERSIVGPIAENNNFMRIEYASSIALSPSSISFVLTNMAFTKTTNNRVGLYSLQAKDAWQVNYNLDQVFSPLLLDIETDLSARLWNPKLDIVYVPNLPQRLITKYGFVFVDDSLFNIRNEADFEQTLKEHQAIAATAVMQVYFGELASHEWWSNWWISKGLARCLSGLLSDTEIFIFETVQKALHNDNLGGSSLGSPVVTINAINNPDLMVIDRKAGALMRMIANVIGEETFKQAAVDLLSLNLQTAISSDAFYAHLENYTSEAVLPPSTTLTTILRSWEDLSGYPILSVSRKDDNTVAISQAQSDQKVDIPVDYFTSLVTSESKPKLWLSKSQDEASIETGNSWIFVNPLQYGFYRVKYDDTLWTELVNLLKTAAQQSLSSLNRVQLIDDTAGLAISGDYSFEKYFGVIEYLPREVDTFVWKTVGSIFEDFSTRFGALEERTRFLYYHNSLANSTYLANKITSSNFQLTLQVGRVACFSGNSQCIEDAGRLLNDTLANGAALSGPEDFQYMVYCTLATYLEDTSGLVNALIRALVDDDNLESALVAIKGLGCSTDAALLKTLYGYAGSRQLELLGIFLTSTQRTVMFRSFLYGGYNATKEGLQYILENYITLSSLMDMDDLLSNISDKIYEPDLLRLLQDIRSTHSIRMTDSVRNVVAQQIGASSLNVNWLSNNRNEVNQWLKDNVELPGGAIALKAINSLLILLSVFLLKYLM